MVDLGTIERVDLREVWPHEAQDFTPWLADNLDKLGEALGLDLELQEREAPVGPFFLDVLAYDRGNDRPVIIENQLESTNHTHLGQLLTYATGYDAGVVIWLTGDFQDEHRAALDWLNQRTGEDTEFFGVVVEAWKIDGSRAAPHFRIVAAPNTWSKSSAKGKTVIAGGAGSERGERYRNFSQPIVDTMRDQYKFTNRRSAGTRSWCVFGSGFPGIMYGAVFMQKGRAKVEISVDSDDREWNKQQFDCLLERKATIQSEIAEPLEWDYIEGRRACRIRVVRNGNIHDDTQTLGDLQDWMVDRLLTFRQVFTPHLQELVD